MKKLLWSAAVAVGLMVPAANAAGVYVRFGPPPIVRERVVVVRPSPRHVWVPGSYRWSGARYDFAPGYWAIPPRPHAVWVPGYWAHRHGGYVWVTGFWR